MNLNIMRTLYQELFRSAPAHHKIGLVQTSNISSWRPPKHPLTLKRSCFGWDDSKPSTLGKWLGKITMSIHPSIKKPGLFRASRISVPQKFLGPHPFPVSQSGAPAIGSRHFQTFAYEGNLRAMPPQCHPPKKIGP